MVAMNAGACRKMLARRERSSSSEAKSRWRSASTSFSRVTSRIWTTVPREAPSRTIGLVVQRAEKKLPSFRTKTSSNSWTGR